MDTYCYIYNVSFNPNSPSLNLLRSDDDSYGSLQFLISTSLVSTGSYVLVATTYSQNAQGAFSVMGSGSGTVAFTNLNNPVINTTTSTTTTSTTTSKERERSKLGGRS